VPDAVLVCEKQRNGEWEGKLKLWFDYKSQQYIEEADRPIHQYLGAK
jgi:twinkle protein